MEQVKQSTKLIFRAIPFALIFAGIILTGTSCRIAENVATSDQYIDIDSRSPWYWNYYGKTLLLRGGSWQDNLFNHPGGLEEHPGQNPSAGPAWSPHYVRLRTKMSAYLHFTDTPTNINMLFFSII